MAEHDRCHRAVLPKAGNGRRPYPLETMHVFTACSIGTT
jgi:IS5 family transposase